MSRWWVAVILTGVGCSGSGSSSSPSDDAPGGPTGHLSFETACGAITSLAFPSTSTGQTATAIVFAINDGTTPVTLGSNTALAHVDGADATEFGVDVLSFVAPYSDYEAAFNCIANSVLPPHAWCQLALQYTPTAEGMHQGSYSLGDGAGVLPMTGTAIAPPTTLHADLANIALGFVSRAQGSGPHGGTNFAWTQTVNLVNDSTSTVATKTLAVDAPFLLDTAGCPTNLTPGGACQAKVSLPAGTIPGLPAEVAACGTGHMTGGGGLDLPVTYTPPPALFPATFHILQMGNGTGTVTFTSPPLTCALGNGGTGDCSVMQWDPPPTIQLAATPTNGSGFAGWIRFGDEALLPCGTQLTCTQEIIPPSLFVPTTSSVQAWFTAPTDKAIHITIVGSGNVAGAATCDASCTLYVPPGGSADLVEFTSGTFQGWSGDCSGKADCNLGSVVNDRNVTATFSP